jgi:hypothetical protein
VLASLLKENEVHHILQINRYNDILWFNKESFEEMLGWLMLEATVEISSDPVRSPSEIVKDLEDCYETVKSLEEAEKKSGYQVEKLLEILRESKTPLR